MSRVKENPAMLSATVSRLAATVASLAVLLERSTAEQARQYQEVKVLRRRVDELERDKHRA